VLMVYTLIPLHDAIARRRTRQARSSHSFLPSPCQLPISWRPLLILSGLRGALSVALVLSLPLAFPERDLLMGIVYGVVLVTLLGQGIGLRVLLPRWPKKDAGEKLATTEA
jgi:NhaP-type Na+/H+ or K+/H+ antiporter